jgi:hypothetical protein
LIERLALSVAANPLTLSGYRSYDNYRVWLILMKKILSLLVALSVVALTAPLAQAITLPVGDWSVNGNGSHGTLHISGIDVAGNIEPGSTIYGNPIVGFYDSTSGRISFIRALGSTAIYDQVYNGYIFRDLPNPSLYFLAGDFAAYKGGGGVAQRINYGWYASKSTLFIPIPVPVPVPVPVPGPHPVEQ